MIILKKFFIKIPLKKVLIDLYRLGKLSKLLILVKKADDYLKSTAVV